MFSCFCLFFVASFLYLMLVLFLRVLYLELVLEIYRTETEDFLKLSCEYKLFCELILLCNRLFYYSIFLWICVLRYACEYKKLLFLVENNSSFILDFYLSRCSRCDNDGLLEVILIFALVVSRYRFVNIGKRGVRIFVVI